MDGEPFYEPINLLVFAESFALQNNFTADVIRFLQDENYKPSYSPAKHMGDTIFRALYYDFRIFNGPRILGSDTPQATLTNFLKIQDDLIRPLNFNAIIFLMQSDPLRYERFLSLNLFNNFSKDDMAKIEKNVIFVFVHNDPVSYQKSCAVDEDLRTILDRIGADLINAKTFHYHSRMNKDFSNIFLQFIQRNKRPLLIETVYLHKSVVKVVGNEDILDLLLDALFVNEMNIENGAAGKTKEYFFKASQFNSIICKKCLKNCYLYTWESLKNKSTCTQCNCFVKDHKLSKYNIGEKKLYSMYAGNNQKEYRHTLITTIVGIDLFHKENNVIVGQLYHRIMERIKEKTSYSVLETLYKNKMDSPKKGITADDCMKCIRNSLLRLKDFIQVDDDFKHNSFMATGILQVKN